MDTQMAMKTWEMSNSIESVSGMDEIYRYDEKQQKAIQSAKPWEKEWGLLQAFIIASITISFK